MRISSRAAATFERRQEAVTGATFLLPGFGLIAITVLVPMVAAFALSFTYCTRFLTISWAGLANYGRLFTDPAGLNALGNTVLYAAVFVPANLVFALIIALLLNRDFPGMKVIRSVYFVPVAVSGIVAVSIFRFIFDRSTGPVNALLSTLGFEPVPWLWSADWAMLSIIIMSLWKSTAFFSIILLAALQEVPRQLHEAAMVDGAGLISRFFNVTLPSIRGVVITIVTLSSIGAFRVFEPMFVLTQGGPADSTRTIALLAYDAAFRDGEIGYANAISFALLAVILLVTLALNKLTGKSE